MRQPTIKGFKKSLPTKNCEFCKKPFQYRKKWKDDWQFVKYCSSKCSKEAKQNKKT
jgi:hypothetical protein